MFEYSYGFGLYNWKFATDKSPDTFEYTNEMLVPKGVSTKKHLSMIRKFNGCTDEEGFCLNHVAIVSKSNMLVQAHDIIFEGVRKQDRALVNKGMQKHLVTLKDMSETFALMWAESRPKMYLNFRTFIMGITGNEDIFPGGVLYKGLSDQKLSFRGETGA